MTGQSAMRALAEPRRQAVLRLIREEPHSVGEIAAHFEITQQAVSQHLQVLKNAGLVSVRKDGQRRLYVVRPDGLDGLNEFLAGFWPSQLARLKAVVESDGDR
jgi:DNA-binding transcriptional ArsR family regulator